MTLVLSSLYEKQEYLEQFVRKNIGMEEDEFSSVPMVDRRVFAFKVEFGEFANETAWFKYWKQSHQQDRAKVLEELSDCIHFLLAIGIYREYKKFVPELNYSQWVHKPEHELYHDIMNSPIGSSGQWKTAFEQLIAIGIKLDFEIEQIILGFYLKHQKNLERQMNNY
jgi:dimeric dUTPase (all-alpha-NTP-PPase superfamily)